MKGFEFLSKMKKEGKIKCLGFSYHDNAKFLDKILNEHPETELVQLQINYIDWEDQGIEARKCYEVCCKHKSESGSNGAVKRWCALWIYQKVQRNY